MENIIHNILMSKSRREVLKYLYASEAEITGRELAKRIGFSYQQTHNALHQLIALGIVERRIFPPIHLFRLDREHRLTIALRHVWETWA